MRFKHFFPVFILISLADRVKAQSIGVNWKDKLTYNMPGEPKKTYAKVSDNNVTTSLINGVPTLYYEYPTTKELTVKELLWVPATNDEILDLSLGTIPDNDFFESIWRPRESDGKMVLCITAGGFKQQNGKIYRLDRIDLMEEELPEGGKKARNRLEKIGTTDNPLKSGDFYKIKVDKSGIFKITTKFLRDNGINPANINPKNFKIYGNGGVMLPEFSKDMRFNALQQNAIEVIGEADGKWDEGDYALFYARGPHGYELFSRTSTFRPRKGYADGRLDRPRHAYNIYDDYSYYYICFDEKAALRVEEQTGVNLNTVSQRTYTDFDNYAFINQNTQNPTFLGRSWVGEALPESATFGFDIEEVVMDKPYYYRGRFMAVESLNNEVFLTSDKTSKQVILTAQPTFFNFQQDDNIDKVNPFNANRLDFTVKFFNNANPSGKLYLDYLEIDYTQKLKFNNKQLSFRKYDMNERRARNFRFRISNASQIDRVWNVANWTVPINTVNLYKEKATDKDIYEFIYRPITLAQEDNFSNEFVAFKLDSGYEPIFVGKIQNQDIPKANIEYLVIAPPEFKEQAQRLADYHSKVNKYTTHVITPQEIYNEYSSGSKDITAIRDYVSDLYASSKPIKFLTLLGDSSNDLKNARPNNDNKILSYVSEYGIDLKTSYISDDYFVMVEPDAGSINQGRPNLAVGRLLASNEQEAKDVVDKTLAYYNALPGQSSPFGTWRMNLDFYVDDDNIAGTNKTFHSFSEFGLNRVFEKMTDKKEYFVSKNYFDAFKDQKTAGGQRFPLINQKLSSSFFNSLYTNYMGHGGPFGFAEERALTYEETLRTNGRNKLFTRLPVLSTITCDFTIWDNPNIKSGGETLYKKPDGGAVAMVTSSRALYENYGIGSILPTPANPTATDESFSNRLHKFLFQKNQGKFLSVSTQLSAAKRDYGINGEHLKVNFLGDPALVMARPENNIVIEKIETPIPNQVRAQDLVTVTGYVKKTDGSVDTNFSGNLAINIYDKPLTKTTLNNDGNLEKITFQQEPTAVIKTAGKVVNGKFTAQFYTPKDINIDLGTGRMLLYADNGTFDVYQNKPIQIGGINENGLKDNTPPIIKLFMNNNNFVNGGITNKNPLLIACLSDDTGINASGSGVGHDISLVLDGQVVNTIVLNEYYTPGENKICPPGEYKPYQLGSVGYPFSNLKAGPHQISVKAWDLNNNSATETLDFIVKDNPDQSLVINKPLNWPNPFTQKTYFQFEHNCDDVLDVNVQVYTISGKLVKNIRQLVSSDSLVEGYRTPQRAIEWDGTDDFGDALAKGTYVYKLTVASTNSTKCKGTATAIEKLVILK